MRGSTWDHPRGFHPLLATARQFMLEHPGMHIDWDRRTLTEFAEISVLDLAERYDLIVLDHPWIGAAVERNCLLPLDKYLDSAFLAHQAAHSVGQSHASYRCAGHQWALAIDAAGQVSTYRPDLLAALELDVPRRWEDVVTLAAKLHSGKSQMAMPFMAVDCSCAFLSLCANFGERPMCSGEYVVSQTMGRRVFEAMKELRDLSHPECLNWNPPQLLDRMAETDEIAYCPLLFGYSNYARTGFRRHSIHFANIPAGADGKPSGALLGGAGLAVSRHSRWPTAACEYAAFVANPTVQCGIYFTSGGQPGHRSAWLDPAVNDSCCQFFRDTLETLEFSYLRPTFNGYIAVQDAIARIVHGFLEDRTSLNQALDQIDIAYRENRTRGIELYESAPE
ncbi:MAG: extracellular solute-binding protein [Terracidiphilus sp.]